MNKNLKNIKRHVGMMMIMIDSLTRSICFFKNATHLAMTKIAMEKYSWCMKSEHTSISGGAQYHMLACFVVGYNKEISN